MDASVHYFVHLKQQQLQQQLQYRQRHLHLRPRQRHLHLRPRQLHLEWSVNVARSTVPRGLLAAMRMALTSIHGMLSSV